MNLQPTYNSAQYLKHYEQVATINAVYDGVDSASLYLTKFPREVESAFSDRQSKVTLKNFVRRIVSSTRNIAINKPPVIEVHPTIEPMLSSIDRTSSIDLFIREVTMKVVRDGFTYVVIDAPRIDESIQTRSDEQKNSIRPYIYSVDRNSVPNWKLNADGTFQRFTIRETYASTEGRYDDKYEEQYRVYLSDGTVEIWRSGNLAEIIQLGVDFVPVVKIGSSDIPFLYDIAKLNVNHMNRRSNLDRYLTIAALPVPVMYGSLSDDAVVIGVDDAIVFSDKNDSGFEWVEVKGTSLKALQDDLATTEEAILAEAVSLTSDDTVAKNSDQINSENMEGFGRLTQLVTEVEVGMNKVLYYFGKFINIEDAGTVSLSREFKDTQLTSEQVKDLIALHANGLVSTDTALQRLIEGKVLELEDIDAEKLRLMDATA